VSTVWNQYNEWPALLAVGVRADELGVDSLWTLSLSHVCPSR
jgi:hypothetical protein